MYAHNGQLYIHVLYTFTCVNLICTIAQHVCQGRRDGGRLGEREGRREGQREEGREEEKEEGREGGREGGSEGGREHRSEGRAYKCLVKAAGAMYAHNRQLHVVYTVHVLYTYT